MINVGPFDFGRDARLTCNTRIKAAGSFLP
jgi:hypothetical protein